MSTADGHTRIALCGRLEVEWEGERIDDSLRGRQGRLLFAYLALNHRRPVRRDELVAAVWPEEGASGAEGLLAPLLSRLRKLVGAERLRGRGELSLVLPEGARIDWEEVHAQLERARAAAASGAWRDALRDAQEAAGTAGAGFLPGLEAPWIDECRRELSELRIDALELAARAGVALGGPALAGAQQAARAAVEAAPFRESAHAALIEGLWARGNVAEALRAFEDLRVLLREELGTAPGPELLELHAKLLAGEAAPVAAAPEAAPARRGPDLDLVERERELGELGELIADAREGRGRAALLEGPAGVGKTRLLVEVRRRAERDGAWVLSARAGELERDFPFGVVRQLLEGRLADPAARERLLTGAAAPAAAVFSGLDLPDRPGDAADASFAVLHGLFWLVLNLAAERPLVVAVDDLHWCDRPSLRFLAYVVRRLEGLPVLVAATLRTGEAPADAALLDEIINDPSTVSVRPEPLSVGATRVVVRARLGAEAADAFCAACHAATGGNPLLLRQLLSALEADQVTPDAASAEVVRRIGPRAVSRTVGLRLARMPAGTVAVAEAIAVLGERAELPVVAALAGLDVAGTAAAVAQLARAEVLRPDPPLGFVHPLVRDAVYSALPVGERDLRHARAARVLADAGAPDDAVAVNLLSAPTLGDPWAAEVLHRAGSSAARRGAADGAVAYLRRALAEPPPPERRAGLLLELGRMEQAVDGPAAVVHLRSAYELLEDPETRGHAAFALAWTMFFVAGPPDTVAFAREAAAELPAEHEDLAYALEAVEFVARLAWGIDTDELVRLRRRRVEERPRGGGPGAKMLMAITAFDWAVDGGAREDCVALATAALEGGELVAADNGLMIPATGSVLEWADHHDAVAMWDVALAEAHRRGSLFLTLTVHLWRGRTLQARGELGEAEASLREGIEELTMWGSGAAVQGYPAAFLGQVLLDRGDLLAASAVLKDARPPEGSQPDSLVQIARAEVLLAEGRPAEALAIAEPLPLTTGHQRNPAWLPWRSTLGRCLAAMGRTFEAVGMLDEELALARSWGAPASLGRVLRERGTVEGAEDVALVEEAVRVLERSHARLERAKALAALGVMRRAAGLEAEARPSLEAARDLARICGAEALEERCSAELAAGGAVAPAAEPAGPAALTDVERRVAMLAAVGEDARGIAQRLFLTPRQAEGHLGGVLAKLGIADPADLPEAMAPAA